MLVMFEIKLMVIGPRFETMLSHANVNLCFTGCCSDSGFVDDIVDKASTIKRAKVFTLGILCENLLYHQIEAVLP